MRDLSPKQRLHQLITGGWISQAVYAASKLGIADYLDAGPRKAAELANQIDCHAGALHRLLRALASAGLFKETEDHRFSLTEVGDCLRTDSPDSARNSSIMVSEIMYQTWGELLHSIQTGESAFAKVHGAPIFEYFAANEQQARIFDAGMISWMQEEADAIVGAYEWPDEGRVVDIGGGSGGMLLTLLNRHPQLMGVIFDLPEVVDRNRALHESDDTYTCCELQGGNFFSSVPDGADIYLLRNIIHDWDDEQSLKILRNCREVCNPTSKVLLMEYVIPEGNDPFAAKWLDLMMLVGPGGQERTETEYRDLLDAAGLSVTGIIPTTTDMSIVESQPA